MKRRVLLGSSALSFFFLGASTASAGPLAAIASVVGAIASGAGIAQAVVGLALSVGSTLLSMAMAKKPSTVPIGVELEVQVGDDQAVSTTIGRFATSGKRKYIGSFGNPGGTPNAYLVDVIELGNLPIAGRPGVWIDDEKCTILWDEDDDRGYGHPIKEMEDDGEYKAWIRFHDGSQVAPDSYLRDKFGADEERPYTSDMIGYGIPYVIMTYRVNQELFRGQPKALFEVSSLPLYDIRKDSTNGGNGSHRWDDQSTWEPSFNLAVQAYNVARGLFYNGKWFYGGQGVAPHRLPAAAWIAAAQECARQIEVEDEDPVPQFRGGLEITGDTPPIDVLDEFRKAMNGRFVDSAGILKPMVGAPGAAVFAFTDADIIVTEAQGFDPFPPLDQTVNAINATYPEPEEKWAPKDAPPLYNEDLEARDTKRLATSIEFKATSYNEQVQRLMSAAIKEERRFRKHQLWLPPEAYALEPGVDTVAWRSAYNGYNAKKFLVVEIEGDPTMNQLVTLQEIDPSDYDWSSTFKLPASTGWIGRITPPVQEMEGWQVQAATIDDNDGSPRRPAIKISCDAQLDDIARVWVQVRKASTEEVVFDSDQSPYAAPYAWLLSGSWCLSAHEYEARGKYVPITPRKTKWSSWLSVTTPDIKISLDELTADIVERLEQLKEWMDSGLEESVVENAQALLQEVQDRVTAISQEETARVEGAIEAAQRYRAVLSELATIRDNVVNSDFSNFKLTSELRTTLSLRLDAVYAEFDERIRVAVGEDGGVAQRVTTLEVGLKDARASVLSADTASVDRDNALAARMDLLSVGTDNQFDPVRLWPFDTSVEGWTGNGLPTQVNGHLRPANAAADPYVVSPGELAVSGNSQRQVRARIRRVGAPVWEGYAWWKSTTDTSWDAARRVAVPAPIFDTNGEGNLTWSMPWTGTVDQIRIDLSAAQTATDYFEFDWISIGSPSPGASRAELLTEQKARASGDAANAASIAALQAMLLNESGEISVLADAVDTIEVTVTNLEDSVSAQSTALQSLNAEVDGKADQVALDTLTAEVESMGGGGVVAQGSAIRALRSQLDNMAAELLDQGFADFIGRAAVRDAVASASQTLTTSIELTNVDLEILSKAVTQVRAALPDKAEASALTALTVRVTATEGSLVSQAEAITAISSSLDGKAAASALTALTNRVTETEDLLDAQAGAITSINSSLAGKASSNALNSLNTRVGDVEDELESQAEAITSINSALGGKASANALSTLSTKVSDIEGEVEAQASSLSSISALVDGVTADARFQMQVVSGPSGYARIGGRVRYGTSGSFRSAGFYLDVPSDVDADSLFVVEANQFAFRNGSSRKVPFAIVDDKVLIQDLQVEKSNIVPGSATDIDSFSSNSSLDLTTGSTVTVASCRVNVAAGETVVLWGMVNVSLDSTDQVRVTARCYRDGDAFGSYQRKRPPKVSVGDQPEKYSFDDEPFVVMTQDTPGRGEFTYTLRVERGTAGSQTATTSMRSLIALVRKR